MNLANSKSESNTRMYEEINAFVIRKRKDVILTLFRVGELSQKDLAATINSSPASLANILCKMFDFFYPLLKCRSVGKQRYYSLTALGQEYAGIISEEKTTPISESWKKEEKNLIQNGEMCLRELQELSPDGWECVMDDILLLYFLRGDKVSADEYKAIESVAGFLEVVETAILNGYDTAQYKLMEHIQNSILKKRIEEVLNDFIPFIFVLNNMKNEQNIYKFYDLVIAIVNGDTLTEEVQQMITEGNHEKEYEELRKVFRRMNPRFEGWSKQEILEYLSRLIPQNRNLCYVLANEVWSK